MLKLLSRDAEIIGYKNISRTIDLLGNFNLSDSIKKEIIKIKDSLDIILSHVTESKKLNFNKIKGVSIEGIDSKKVDIILRDLSIELEKIKNIDLEDLLISHVGEQSEFLEEKVISALDDGILENDILTLLEIISSWYNEDKMKKYDGKRKRLNSDFKKLLDSKKVIDGYIHKIKTIELFIENVEKYREKIKELELLRSNQEVNKENKNSVVIKDVDKTKKTINEESKIIEDQKNIIKNDINVKTEEKIEKNKEFYSENIDKITTFLHESVINKDGKAFIRFIDKYFDKFSSLLKLQILILLEGNGIDKNILETYFRKINLNKLSDSELLLWDKLDAYIYSREEVNKDKSYKLYDGNKKHGRNKKTKKKDFELKGMWKTGTNYYDRGEIVIDTEDYDTYTTGLDIETINEGDTLDRIEDNIYNENIFLNQLKLRLNNFLKERDLEKVYSLLLLLDVIEKDINNKIYEVLLFELSKKEKKKNGEIIKKILKILNN